MIRTIIITIEADNREVLENAEDDLLRHCNDVTNCEVFVNICAQPLSPLLIDSLCNPPMPTVSGYTSRGAVLLQAVTARQRRAKTGE